MEEKETEMRCINYPRLGSLGSCSWREWTDERWAVVARQPPADKTLILTPPQTVHLTQLCAPPSLSSPLCSVSVEIHRFTCIESLRSYRCIMSWGFNARGMVENPLDNHRVSVGFRNFNHCRTLQAILLSAEMASCSNRNIIDSKKAEKFSQRVFVSLYFTPRAQLSASD